MKKIKYSKIREKIFPLKLEKEKSDRLAHITHYLQNHSEKVDFRKKNLKAYLNGNTESIAAEPEFQYELKIDWDIPFPPHSNPKFTFIDLFAGIGGIRLAFQSLGGKCVFTSEWNEYAKKTYEANFGEVPFGDITKIKEYDIPDHEILLGGFPCQPFSLAGVSKKNALGKAHGFLDKTQGTLFFDIARILKEKQPKAFLLENVKNLVSHDKGNTFKIINDTLNDLGYNVVSKIIDGRHYVPQHRERIMIVGFRKDLKGAIKKFKFPELPIANKKVKDILDLEVDPKYTLSDKLWQYLQNYAAKHKALGNGFGFGLANLDSITRTLSARYYKDGAEILIPQQGKNPRRLTPKECSRLQGFPEKFLVPVSDCQAYKQFGNSVVSPLIKSVGRELIKALEIDET